MSAFRVLVTGSRDWDDLAVIEDALCRCAEINGTLSYHKLTVVHGAAAGADCYAAGIAHALGMEVEAHPADWTRHGKGAGSLRNREMVDAGADICLAFIKNNSRGATQCADLADMVGIPVRRYEKGGFGDE